MNIKIRQNVLPVITAFIWGTTFVAQNVGAKSIGTFTFNASRSFIAFVFLTFLILISDSIKNPKLKITVKKGNNKNLIVGGICCGTVLFVATNLQQAGIEATTVGKASFISALYIVLVPIFSIFLGKKTNLLIWVSVLLAIIGMYFLCITDQLKISKGDLLVLVSSVMFSIHILTIDRFTNSVDGVRLSCVQFLTNFVLSTVFALVFEKISFAALANGLIPIVYAGVFSSGIAYTLQIVAQKGSNPTVVSLLLSLESVFGSLSGALFLGERLSDREIVGCVFMLIGVVLAQFPEKSLKSKLKA